MTTQLTPQQAKMVAAEIGRVEKIARAMRKQLPNVADGDLESAGNEALVLAATRFDPGLGVPFGTFAHYRIRGAMIDFVRASRPVERSARRALVALDASQKLLEQASEDQSGERQTLEARVAAAKALVERTAAAALMAANAVDADLVATDSSQATAEDLSIANQQREKIKAALASLSEADRELVRAIYDQERSMHNLAAAQGCNVSTISRRHSRILGDLAQRLRDLAPSPAAGGSTS
jgi:RNA polymerase sigma factor for flagellar operon FliA